ncbi:MAG: NAD-dependent epimerase/dehydratase family protein [Dissulfuribacterales bacterium]
MKVIVFGGSGFLGSHVADFLTQAGHDVTIFDSKQSPYLLPGQSMYAGDILNPEQVLDAVGGHEIVYNFAGLADLDDATTRPVDTIRLNIEGNINILEACRMTDVKRFIYASTIYVYSDKGGFYRCSKQASETYIEEVNRKYGLDFTILRYGTLYGPRADERNSIYRYLREALETGSVVCSGSGEEMREYIDVRDAARLSVDILDDGYKNQHIIISGHYPMKFKEMILMIQEILGKNIKIEFSAITNPDHYTYTPYSFTPKVGHKLVNHRYLDMGQGFLECLHEINQKSGQPPV